MDSDDSVARGLRLVADDCQLLAHDAVEECGFAGVGLTNDRDDSSLRHEGIVRDVRSRGQGSGIRGQGTRDGEQGTGSLRFLFPDSCFLMPDS